MVNADEKERGLGRILNFGHTFGHAVENRQGISHDEAAAAGTEKFLRNSPEEFHKMAVNNVHKLIQALQAQQLELEIQNEDLRKAYENLEKQVQERTAELEKANQDLKLEKKMRERVEAALRKSEERFRAARDADSYAACYEGTVEDISDRKRMEETLRERENTLNAILAASPVGIGLVRNRTLDWANRGMYQIVGYEEDSLLGKDASVLYPTAGDYNRVGRKLYSGTKEGGSRWIETQWVRCDGQIIDCYLQSSPLDPNNLDKGTIVVAMDITDRKRAEDYIHLLSQQLLKAQESERQMISRELHDRVAQDLSAAKIDCDLLSNRYQNIPSELENKILATSATLQKTIRVVRDLAYDLRPPGLEKIGLTETVSQYCQDFADKMGLPVDFRAAGMTHLNLDNDTEINIYRLVQEGLTNIQKHAAASRVIIKLIAAYPQILLRIEDDGKGFDLRNRMESTSAEKRMGLRSMEERVKLLNGVMTIKSRPGQGTRIFIKLPQTARSIRKKEYAT